MNLSHGSDAILGSPLKMLMQTPLSELTQSAFIPEHPMPVGFLSQAVGASVSCHQALQVSHPRGGGGQQGLYEQLRHIGVQAGLITQTVSKTFVLSQAVERVGPQGRGDLLFV